ncbi:V-SNARE coiled-coil-like proteiny domain-containing protein [Aphelenchoides bicaudatus]|nr:V-SNARE coiled-coil-like proteiny domain-containing protein [Aphelenchoides bicaudatus]
MPIINQLIVARIDQNGKNQRLSSLASSHQFEEATNSANPFTDELPNISDICSLVERKVTQQLADKKLKVLLLNKDRDLYWQVCVEPDFTACFLCISSKGVEESVVTSLFEQIRNTYVEVDYVRVAIISETLDTLPQFKSFINRELEALNSKMSALNDQKNSMRVSDLQQQVQEVRTVMTDNVTRVMERGERLEDLDQRAENLQQSSAAFKTSARRVQRNMCFKNAKWTIILGSAIGLLVVIGVILILHTAGLF